MSVARPNGVAAPSVLSRLLAERAIGRASVLWDMRPTRSDPVVAIGALMPPDGEASDTTAGMAAATTTAAMIRLYAHDDREVTMAGEAVAALARAGALVRILRIEVRSRADGANHVLPTGPMWALLDMGVRACYFERADQRIVVDALASAGHDAWRASPLWTRGAVLSPDALAVVGTPLAQAPTLALVLAGRDASRPVRLRLDREAYVRVPPPHEVRFRWPSIDVARRLRADGDGGGVDDDLAVDVEYAQVDIASWSDAGPAGVCLVGNCAFQGRAVLVDYEANAVAVYSA